MQPHRVISPFTRSAHPLRMCPAKCHAPSRPVPIDPVLSCPNARGAQLQHARPTEGMGRSSRKGHHSTMAHGGLKDRCGAPTIEHPASLRHRHLLIVYWLMHAARTHEARKGSEGATSVAHAFTPIHLLFVTSYDDVTSERDVISRHFPCGSTCACIRFTAAPMRHPPPMHQPPRELRTHTMHTHDRCGRAQPPETDAQ
eukprot:CAMPEP_0174695678 /NCGR_PEP_ID=MMETSP1094-20130205/2012_1 /TAXON_ID=156173 /ORGANISM="Chrysochromulina brevifilum, Strain UTEX LB 985" /LENGTH=198 /DNA_ID=CAMNT_0015892245 /DNA_START=131 /DNA_END=724 /DNA_ORIENTATION=-